MSGGGDPDKQRERLEQYRVSMDLRLEYQTKKIKHLEEQIVFLSGKSTVDPRIVPLEKQIALKKLQLEASMKKSAEHYDKYKAGLRYKYKAMMKIDRLEATLAKIKAVCGEGTIRGVLMDVTRLIKEHAVIEESRADAEIGPFGIGVDPASAGAAAAAEYQDMKRLQAAVPKQEVMPAATGAAAAAASQDMKRLQAAVPKQEVMPAATGAAPDVSVPDWWRALVDIAGPSASIAPVDSAGLAGRKRGREVKQEGGSGGS